MESYIYEESNRKSASLAKVFGLMFLGIIVSFIVAFGLIVLLGGGSISTSSYATLLVGSSIALFILIFVSQFVVLRTGKGGLITFGLYSIVMGVLISSVLLTIGNLTEIVYIFGATALSFGTMALYGLFTKRSTLGLGMFASGLFVGIITLSIINWFIGSEMIYYLISYAGLIAMLAITAFDINQTKKLQDNGMLTNNLAIYMALQLYTDFIYIFLRIAMILARNRR